MGNETSVLYDLPTHRDEDDRSPKSRSSQAWSQQSEYPSGISNARQTQSYATPRSRHNHMVSLSPLDPPNVGAFVDPVVAAAAAGAAAKMAKDDRQQRLRRSPVPVAQLPFRIEVDNEWKASLQRFARTAASTAKTVRTVAAPVLAEAAQTYQQASSSATKHSQSFVHDNHVFFLSFGDLIQI